MTTRNEAAKTTPKVECSGERISLTFGDWQIPLVLNDVARRRVGFSSAHVMVNCVTLPDGRVRLDYDPDTGVRAEEETRDGSGANPL